MFARTDDERARDHLANERTFLAWMRTGIATMGFGVVIGKFKYLAANEPTAAKGLFETSHVGLLFGVIGLVSIFLAVFLFLQTRSEIRAANYKSRIGLILVFTAFTIALGLVVLIYMFQT